MSNIIEIIKKEAKQEGVTQDQWLLEAIDLKLNSKYQDNLPHPDTLVPYTAFQKFNLGDPEIPDFIDSYIRSLLQKRVEKNQKNTKITDSSSKIDLIKKQNTMTDDPIKKRAKKRTRNELPFPEFSPKAEINLTKKQTKLRLQPKLLEAVEGLSKSQGIPRNEWITEAIKEKLRLEAPTLT